MEYCQLASLLHSLTDTLDQLQIGTDKVYLREVHTRNLGLVHCLLHSLSGTGLEEDRIGLRENLEHGEGVLCFIQYGIIIAK